MPSNLIMVVLTCHRCWYSVLNYNIFMVKKVLKRVIENMLSGDEFTRFMVKKGGKKRLGSFCFFVIIKMELHLKLMEDVNVLLFQCALLRTPTIQ